MKYNHALFINPYNEDSATSAMRIFPPTGLEYVATSAKECAGKVTLLDLRYKNELSDTEKLLDFISREVDIVCVGISWDRQLEAIFSLLNRFPAGIPLVIGGYTATEKVEEIFKNCQRADIIVRGEGEETIREILKGAPLDSIMGISYRAGGNVVHNKNRPLPAINTLAYPDRSLRHNEYRLFLNDVKIANLSFDTVLSSRGCPFNCKFCTFTLNPLGQKRNYSARDPASVADEIAGISANVILFSDENFAVNPKWAEQICDLIIARKIKKRFAAQVRIDIAKHPSLLGKMVKAGFKILLLGIESPHDWILTQLDKGFDSDTIRKSLAALKKYPMFYHGYFIYGNIGETEEQMLYIPRFAREIGVDSITCLKLRIEKFSPLRELAQRAPGYHITESGQLYSDTYSYADLKKIGRRIKFSFYTPARLLRILCKAIRIRFLGFGEIFLFLLAVPLVIENAIIRDIRKGRLRDSLTRIFISNKR
ncbi:MAG: radical SAM protein [Candidatus Omnitrophota bacterium]